MICLSLDGVSLSFGGTDILKGLSFSLGEGERLGIVGVNGAGKSSLLKIIRGELEPTSGSVYLAKGKTVGFLRQSALEDPTLGGADGSTVLSAMLSVFAPLLQKEKELDSLRQQLESDDGRGDGHGESSLADRYATLHEQFTEAGGYSFRSRCRGILRSLSFSAEDEEKPIGKLSGGELTRLALGRVLFAEPDLLLLDEPTNHLDRGTLSFLEKFLRDYRKTVAVVSHDRYFLDRVATKILDIEHGKGRLYDGGYTAFSEKKKKDREIEERHFKNQQKEIERIEAYIAQQRRWNRERNIIAAESRQKQLDKMQRLSRPEALPENIRLRFRECLPSGEDVLSVKNLEKRFGDRVLFRNLSFEVKKGDRLLIIGDNGCGKSTLLKLIMGILPPSAGISLFGYHIEAGYYDQANQNLRGDATALDELWDSFPTLTATEVRSTLALFGFRGEEVFKEVRSLSGGERARLTLAKLSLSGTNLLVLDEPTNHLDIGTREVLEDALLSYGGTVIAVSHDRYFINRLGTKILDFRFAGGEKSPAVPFFFDGSYTEYEQFLERKEAENARPEKDLPYGDGATDKNGGAQMTEAKAKYLQGKRNQAEIRKKRSRLREVRSRCAAIEGELEEISILCGDESVQSDHIRLTALYKRQAALEEELLSLYEENEQLEKDPELASCDKK